MLDFPIDVEGIGAGGSLGKNGGISTTSFYLDSADCAVMENRIKDEMGTHTAVKTIVGGVWFYGGGPRYRGQ